MDRSLATRTPISLITLVDSGILLFSRISLAAVFWLSGQTKINGFQLNIVNGDFLFGLPSIKDTTFYLFEYEYALPLISPQIAAYLATIAEHALPVLLLFGLASRYSALGLFIMTLTIQLFVYPDAYATHLTWLTLAAIIMARGAGYFSVDHLLGKKFSFLK